MLVSFIPIPIYLLIHFVLIGVTIS